MQFVLKGHLYCAAGGDTGQGVSAIIPWKLPSYYSSFMPGEGEGEGVRGRVEEGGKIGFRFRWIVCTKSGSPTIKHENLQKVHWATGPTF